MATYKVYNYSTPKRSYNEYLPNYTRYSYKKPDDVYSDYLSVYANDIRNTKSKMDALEASKPGEYNSAYKDRINALIDNIANRKFTYDVNADALYNQYKNSYMTQGKQAMQDAIGQASAMTGGYGNSYAAAVGNQAYQSYLNQLNDRIPELYQLALDKYNTEGAEKQALYSILAGQEAEDYGKYRDAVADYQTDRGYYDAQLQNLRTMGQNLWGQNWSNYWNAMDRNDANYQNAMNTAMNLYNQDWSNYHWAEEQTQRNYEQAVAEDQWNANFAENQRQYNESQAQAAAELAYQREKDQKDIDIAKINSQNKVNNFVANAQKKYIALNNAKGTVTNAFNLRGKNIDSKAVFEDAINNSDLNDEERRLAAIMLGVL